MIPVNTAISTDRFGCVYVFFAFFVVDEQRNYYHKEHKELKEKLIRWGLG